MMVPLPKTNGPDGPRLMLMRMRQFNPKQYHIMDMMRVNMMLNDILLMEDDNFVVAGQVSNSKRVQQFICS
jgi:hypothetical protein